MKKSLSLLAVASMLSGCGGDEATEQNTNTATQATAKSAQILTYVPAQTPLLLTSGLANDQYPDRYMGVLQEHIDAAAKYLEVFLNQAMKEKNHYQVLDENGEEITAETADPTTPDPKKLKVKNFIDKWVLSDQFGKLGLKMGQTQMVAYMVDLLPVLRIKLTADNQIDAMLADLQKEFEVKMVENDLNGIKVRELALKDFTLFIASEGDYLTVSGAPMAIKDQMVASLVGDSKPATSLAQNRQLIDQVKSAHGYQYDDIFVLDIQAIADYFINPAQHNSTMLNFMQIEDNMLSPVCKQEITGMVSNAPRIVAGNKSVTNDTISGSMIWEMAPELAKDLTGLAGRVPHGNADAAFAFGMSFDLLNAKNIASKYVDAIVASPYECEHFAAMNQQASELQAKLSQPIPPFVGNFKGFNLSLDELSLNLVDANLSNPDPKEIIENLKTQVFLAVDETEALLGMAQMMVPQLQEMEIATDGSLITLADTVPLISGKDVPFDIANLYAAVASDVVGFSLGHEGGGDLSTKVTDSGDPVLFKMSTDVDGYKNLMEQIFAMAEMPDLPQSVKDEINMQKELSMSMLYWIRQDASITFTEQGFETDMEIKY